MYILRFNSNSSTEKEFRENFLEKCFFAIRLEMSIKDDTQSFYIIKTPTGEILNTYTEHIECKLSALEEHLFLIPYLASEWLCNEDIEGFDGGTFPNIRSVLSSNPNSDVTENLILKTLSIALFKTIPFKTSPRILADAFECLVNSIKLSMHYCTEYYKQMECAYILLKQQQKEQVLNLLEVD